MALALLDDLIHTFSVAPSKPLVSAHQNTIKTLMKEAQAMSQALVQSMESDLAWSDIPITERNGQSYYGQMMKYLDNLDWGEVSGAVGIKYIGSRDQQMIFQHTERPHKYTTNNKQKSQESLMETNKTDKN